jgi:riboflavin biosynthesis pyrimidine reductase
VRRVIPDLSDDVDLLDAYAVPPRVDAPLVRVNMISSLDGAISVDGRSGALGGSADSRVFTALRSLADVILVGAGTVRAEGYGPARLDDADVQRRVARGQAPQPAIAVVSRAAAFDFATPFFTEAVATPVLVTTAARAASLAREAGSRADVLAVGTDHVDLPLAVAALGDRGARSLLVEGGPGLNGDLARADAIDELCLTVSPRIVGGEGPRILAGPPIQPPIEPRVMHVLEEDGFLFVRMSLRR